MMATVAKLSSSASAFIALGGNLGPCRQHFEQARLELARHGAVVRAVSPLYRTAAVGGPSGQPDYLNAVLQVETALSAEALLALCLEIEQRAGRQRHQHWGPRTLDLDLLLYDERVSHGPTLILPHPRLHLRRFVLEPLCALIPEALHPQLKKSYKQLLQCLLADTGVELVATDW